MKKIFKWLLIGLAVFILLAFAYGRYLGSKPPRTFPTDKEMLEHFNQHRAEFEKLVQYHREYDYLERIKPGSTKLNKEEQKAFMNQTGTQRIYGSAIGWHWHPEPYSEHTIRTLRSLYNRDVHHPATNEEEIETLKREIPGLFRNATPITDASQIFELTQLLEVELKDSRYDLFGKRKVYIHFPQPPMIKNHRIVAVNLSLDDEDSLKLSERVLDSLDNPPKDWKPGECLLKAIDTHWFMATCKSYDYPI